MPSSGQPALIPLQVSFTGKILRRGFWLYVWEIKPPNHKVLYYVGRTGDSSSLNAQSPFNRMSQHLGSAANSNMLRKHLARYSIDPESCEFRLVAVGPLADESSQVERHEHDRRRDEVAAMEKALAGLFEDAGCKVMNEVTSRKTLDVARFAEVRAGFEQSFPVLAGKQESRHTKGV